MGKHIIDWLAKKFLWIPASLLCATLRITREGSTFFDAYVEHREPSVIAFWHGSMLLGWYLHRPRRNRAVAALVSQSADGEILAATLAHWGYVLIRGSSHVGGKESMQRMIDVLVEGSSLCVTPDGPTGPRHRMKMGAVRAAQRSGAHLFLVGILMERKRELKSWDRFEIPMPFARVIVRYSEPIAVPADLQDQALDDFLEATQRELAKLSEPTANGSSAP
ncbi:MAG TPA: lysophospholipid acyltransferase family protein [Bacteroidota bacterium]|nr:lysophospholipid acyltransferase family protein [Bacteroidota bacterium]